MFDRLGPPTLLFALAIASGCSSRWALAGPRGSSPWETNATGALEYRVTVQTFENGVATAGSEQLVLEALGGGQVRVAYAGKDYGARAFDGRGRLGGADDLPVFLDLFSVLPDDVAQLAQTGSTWSRTYPEDATPYASSLLMRSVFAGTVRAADATRSTIGLTATATLEQNDGLRAFAEATAGDAPAPEMQRLLDGMVAGNPYVVGEMVFDTRGGYVERVQVTASYAAAAGEVPGGVATDPNRVEIAISL